MAKSRVEQRKQSKQASCEQSKATPSPRVPRPRPPPPPPESTNQPKPSPEADERQIEFGFPALPWPQTGITFSGSALQQQREDLNLDQKRVSTCDWATCNKHHSTSCFLLNTLPRHPDATSHSAICHLSTSQARNWPVQLRLYSWLLHALSIHRTGSVRPGTRLRPCFLDLNKLGIGPPAPSYWAEDIPGWLGICMLFREP